MFESTVSDPILSFFDLAISQQQLQLFINYIKFFRRAIVDICACKDDLWYN